MELDWIASNIKINSIIIFCIHKFHFVIIKIPHRRDRSFESIYILCECKVLSVSDTEFRECRECIERTKEPVANYFWFDSNNCPHFEAITMFIQIPKLDKWMTSAMINYEFLIRKEVMRENFFGVVEMKYS